MTPAVISILAFLAVLLAIFAVYSLMRDVAQSDSRRIKKRISESFGGKEKHAALFKNLTESIADSSSLTQEEPGWRKSFELMVEQSGLSLDSRGVILRGIGVSLILFILGFGLTRVFWLSVLLGFVGFFVPVMYVNYRRERRLEELRSQLADAYSMMGRVMLAGQTGSQAMQLVASEFSDPIAGEFAYCNEQQNLGLPPEIAMVQMAQRTGLLEVKMFVVASMVQREAGGNLAEVIENLANVIRERFRVRGEVRTLTAEGRFQAAVLLFLPLLLFGVMYLINPQYMSILLEYQWLIAMGFVSEVIGAIWIRRIVNFDF